MVSCFLASSVRYTGTELIPFLHLGPLAIPTFGLMVACAMIAAYAVLRADIARRRLAPDPAATAEIFVAVPCLAGIVGAKLYHVLETPHDLLADPLGQLFSRFGLAWFGGLIAGFAAFAWLTRLRKIPLLVMFDAASPAAALGYAIGRIGCLLSGDGDYGRPTPWHWPWGMAFPHGLVPTTQTCLDWGWPSDCRVYPTPIYEFIVMSAIAWLLWRMGARQISGNGATPPRSSPAPLRNPGALPPGAIFAAYLVLSGSARFLVEFIRINPRSFLGLTNAQAASIVSLIAGSVLSWRVMRTKPG